jgi:hypothetical protein
MFLSSSYGDAYVLVPRGPIFDCLDPCDILAQAASAPLADHMKATAPEKMMPAEMVSKMRECKKRAEEQKIKMEDRSHFVDECVWAKAK